MLLWHGRVLRHNKLEVWSDSPPNDFYSLCEMITTSDAAEGELNNCDLSMNNFSCGLPDCFAECNLKQDDCRN